MADQPESHTWSVQRKRDLLAVRLAAWKLGACLSPGARAAQRAQPPHQPVLVGSSPICCACIGAVAGSCAGGAVLIGDSVVSTGGIGAAAGGGAATVTGAFCSASGWPKN